MKLVPPLKKIASKFSTDIALCVTGGYDKDDVSTNNFLENSDTPFLLISKPLTQPELSDALDGFTQSLSDTKPQEGLIVVLDNAFDGNDNYGALFELVCRRTWGYNNLPEGVDILVINESVDRAFCKIPEPLMNRMFIVPPDML